MQRGSAADLMLDTLTQPPAGLQLGVSHRSHLLQQLGREGRVVAMVGDGINDSPALSFADVGIAMKHGAQVAHESANIVLMEDNLWKLVTAIEISREGVALIKQNYKIVAFMNTVALLLALFFWPSAHDEDSMPTLDEPRRSDPSPRSSGTASVAAERIARASGDFGRRAF